MWFRKVDSESPGDNRTCNGLNDTYDLWVDAVVPTAAVPTSPPEAQTSAAAITNAQNIVGALTLILVGVALNAIV